MIPLPAGSEFFVNPDRSIAPFVGSPARLPQHLKFIRSLPCCACGSTRRIEAAHIGPHGLGQKASDECTVPLCRACHVILHQIGRVRFEFRFSLSLFAVVQRLTARPFIRVVGEAWVGSFEGEEYVLCPKQMDLVEAVRRMSRLRREVLRDWFLAEASERRNRAVSSLGLPSSLTGGSR